VATEPRAIGRTIELHADEVAQGIARDPRLDGFELPWIVPNARGEQLRSAHREEAIALVEERI